MATNLKLATNNQSPRSQARAALYVSTEFNRIIGHFIALRLNKNISACLSL